MSNYEVPTEVQSDLDEMCEALDKISDSHKVRVQGFWIWISNADESKSDEYEDLGFTWSDRRHQWYWPHPDSPKRKKRTRKTKSKSKTNTKSQSKPQRELTEREKLEKELEGINHIMSVDSGENYINIEAMRQKCLLKIAALDNKVVNH